MLPKIFVGNNKDKNLFLESLGLNENYTLSIDASEATISDVREWVLFCNNVLDIAGLYSAVVWNAEKLSPESQAVLLKPLEEKKSATKFFLTVEKETDLLPTILSRCEVVILDKLVAGEVYWQELLKVWRLGPGEILAYAEKFELDKLEAMLLEVMNKIKYDLKNQVSLRRLKVMEVIFEIMGDLQSSAGINRKMALESFLLCSWRAIKTH